VSSRTARATQRNPVSEKIKIKKKKKKKKKLGMEACSCNPNPGEAETGRSLELAGPPV
jgi:hypothetical protein